MTALALDTSVAIPLLVQRHEAHRAVVEWWGGRAISLSGHALAETYSVLTRLPGELRVNPADAVRLIVDRFADPFLLKPATARRIPTLLGGLGIAGGAVYDAIIALAARDHDATLATRDGRAKVTYELVGVRVLVAVAE